MALRFFLVLLLHVFEMGESQQANDINQTDLQVAMSDMRTQSYHGFVILLKIFNSMPNSLQTSDLTFLMPDDEDISGLAITPDRLQDFVLSHSMPTPLLFNNLQHFPNGTMVPSSIPGRMIRITNTGKRALFVNNARIVTPNVCQSSSSISCHGISAALIFHDISTLRPSKSMHNPNKRS